MSQQIDRSYGHIVACIITGNPKFLIKNELAAAYYKEIAVFLMQHGCKEVILNAGEDRTLPPDSGIYIGHSRGCARKRFMVPEKQKRFLCFGDLDGIMHPVDREWHVQNQSAFGRPNPPEPPPEHYIFIEAQKQAIVDLITKISGRRVRI